MSDADRNWRALRKKAQRLEAENADLRDRARRAEVSLTLREVGIDLDSAAGRVILASGIDAEAVADIALEEAGQVVSLVRSDGPPDDDDPPADDETTDDEGPELTEQERRMTEIRRSAAEGIESEAI